jgi:programmed cell death 6-interacting protein
MSQLLYLGRTKSPQKGAGVIPYLISTGLPQFRRSLQNSNTDMPIDFDEMFLKSLQYLLLAQAQECAWQKAMMGLYYYLVFVS